MPDQETSPSARKELDEFLANTEKMGNAELVEAAISLADSLDITHGSFAGRERDAMQSLIGVATYYKLNQRERDAVLNYTSNTFEKNVNPDLNKPKFAAEVRVSASHQLVQPAWFKTSLSNGDLKENAIFWGIIRVVVNLLTKGVPEYSGYAYGAGKILGRDTKVMKRTDEIIEQIYNKTKGLKSAGKIGSFSPPALFVSTGILIATSQYGAMMKEVELRIDRGQMTSADRREIQEEIKKKTYGLSSGYL